MGKKIPGSPVVGFFNDNAEDFEGHNKEISIRSNGRVELKETTKPYGFVPTDAKVWFQKFTDEGVEHEYLVTECYLWTSAFPECKRVAEGRNNQSMELNDESQKGFWAKDDNSSNRIFIYNEALIEKLCILGEDVEPCFEGASFMQEISHNKYSMMRKLENRFSKGGSQQMDDKNKKTAEEEQKKQQSAEKPDETKKDPAAKQDDGASKQEPQTKDEEPKKKYELDEIPEYIELKAQYEALQSDYEALKQEKSTLDSEVASLREFKLQADRKEKQNMIDSFYMLNDEDKHDVVEHIDTYSLDDIEAKLSILCVRNKVNFNLDEGEKHDSADKLQGLFSLQNDESDDAPAWVKAVRETAKKHN